MWGVMQMAALYTASKEEQTRKAAEVAALLVELALIPGVSLPRDLQARGMVSLTQLAKEEGETLLPLWSSLNETNKACLHEGGCVLEVRTEGIPDIQAVPIPLPRVYRIGKEGL